MLTRVLVGALLIAGTPYAAFPAAAADRGLRTQAQALFEPLPTAMTSDENPITPEAFAGTPRQPAVGAGAPQSPTAAQPGPGQRK